MTRGLAFARAELEKGEHQDAWDLVGAFRLSPELLKLSFATFNSEAETADLEERSFNAACKVLKHMDEEGLLPQVQITFMYNGQTIVISLFCVLILFASWVFLTGDDACAPRGRIHLPCLSVDAARCLTVHPSPFCGTGTHLALRDSTRTCSSTLGHAGCGDAPAT